MNKPGAAAKAKIETLPVLLIEDEATVVAFVRAALERSGYRVEVANSALEGLRLLQSHKYWGVISDMRTPGGISGAEVLAWLKHNQPQMTARLLFITGDLANEETAAILKTSGAPFIEKPFRVKELLVAVERILGRGGEI
jgi:DNA-binding response OmpR family regulator